MMDAVRVNSRVLDGLEESAVKFIRNLARRFDEVLVSFSGGKDSMALLLLSIKALGDVKILFNNTGIEAPQTLEYVNRVAEKYGLELLVADAGDGFWRGVEVFGPPARDYRWCCKVAKLVPIARLVKERFRGKRLLMLVGQRRWESLARYKSPPVWRNRWIPGATIASPINEWSALHVWLYLFREGAPVNPLYEMGFDRIGCWPCPASELGEFATVERMLPNLWAKWMSILKRWGSRLPEGWVEAGLWRWRRLPKDQIRHAEKLGLRVVREVWEHLGEVQTSGEGHVVFRLSFDYDHDVVLKQLKMIGGTAVSGDDGVAVTGRGYTAVIRGRVGEVKAIDPSVDLHSLVVDLVGILVRSSKCVGCGSCVNWCPTGALRLRGGSVEFDPSKCTSCRVCNRVCPLVQYLVRHGLRVK